MQKVWWFSIIENQLNEDTFSQDIEKKKNW
jgi:hypothetical protein